MSADEMFEKLEYELWTDDKETVFYKGENKNIIFDKYTAFDERDEVYNVIKNKDQIIDLMAKVINEAYFESEYFEEWFENKICKVQRDEDYTYLEKDIKRYFENKAKELLNK